jgi:small subunit ribosomal protein S17
MTAPSRTSAASRSRATSADAARAATRKTKTGRVVSDKMDKTIVVSVERLARHPLYKRVIRLTTKFKAHDEANDAHVGDTVLIEESRPLSATKRWRLVRVVQRAGDHGSAAELVADEAAVTEAIHGAAHPGRARAESAAGSTEAAEAAEAGEAGDAGDAAGTAAEAAAPGESGAEEAS